MNTNTKFTIAFASGIAIASIVYKLIDGFKQHKTDVHEASVKATHDEYIESLKAFDLNANTATLHDEVLDVLQKTQRKSDTSDDLTQRLNDPNEFAKLREELHEVFDVE